MRLRASGARLHYIWNILNQEHGLVLSVIFDALLGVTDEGKAIKSWSLCMTKGLLCPHKDGSVLACVLCAVCEPSISDSSSAIAHARPTARPTWPRVVCGVQVFILRDDEIPSHLP